MSNHKETARSSPNLVEAAINEPGTLDKPEQKNQPTASAEQNTEKKFAPGTTALPNCPVWWTRLYHLGLAGVRSCVSEIAWTGMVKTLIWGCGLILAAIAGFSAYDWLNTAHPIRHQELVGVADQFHKKNPTVPSFAQDKSRSNVSVVFGSENGDLTIKWRGLTLPEYLYFHWLCSDRPPTDVGILFCHETGWSEGTVYCIPMEVNVWLMRYFDSSGVYRWTSIYVTPKQAERWAELNRQPNYR
jgi:hypothetical protein